MALIAVSGHLKDVSGANIAGSVVFQLVNYGAAIPRVIGTNALVPTNVTFTAAANGAWSGNVQGNDSIDPGSSNTPPTTYYVVTFKDQNGANIQSVPFSFTGAGPSNLDSQAPLVTIPSPTAPPNTAALVAANQTFTGTNTFTGGLVAIAGQNQLTAFNVNGVLAIDGTKYAKTATGINQAITDANTAGGGTVYCPAGTYTLSGTSILLKSNVLLTGAGQATIITQSSATDPMIDWATNNASNAGVENLEVDGGSLVATISNGLNIGGTGSRNYVRRCWIQNIHVTGAAVKIQGSATQNEISSTFFSANTGTHTIGIVYSSLTNGLNKIQNNTISRYANFAIYASQSAHDTITGNNISGSFQKSNVTISGGTSVAYNSGTNFANLLVGHGIDVGGAVGSTIATVNSSTLLTLNSALSNSTFNATLGSFEAFNFDSCQSEIISDNTCFGGIDAGMTLNVDTLGNNILNLVLGNHLTTYGRGGIALDLFGKTGSISVKQNAIIGNYIDSVVQNGTPVAGTTGGIWVGGSTGADTKVDLNYISENTVVDNVGGMTNPVLFNALVGPSNRCGWNHAFNTTSLLVGGAASIITPLMTLKKGSGSGDYSSASTSYVDVDATNLAYTVVIPLAWKMCVTAHFDGYNSTAASNCFFAIFDGSVVAEREINPPGSTSSFAGSLGWIITGDGNSHTIKLQFKTSAGADAVNIRNSSATVTPTMTFLMYPSN